MILRIALAVLLSALLACLAACGGGGSGFTDDGDVTSMLARINAERTGAGLSTLTLDTDLAAIAQTHSTYMAAVGTLTGTNAGGTDILALASTAGFNGSGRIIANGQKEATVFNQISVSSANLAVLNGADYTLAGLGYATGNGQQWWTIIVAETKTP